MKARLMTSTCGRKFIQIPLKGEHGKIKFSLNFLATLFVLVQIILIIFYHEISILRGIKKKTILKHQKKNPNLLLICYTQTNSICFSINILNVFGEKGK